MNFVEKAKQQKKLRELRAAVRAAQHRVWVVDRSQREQWVKELAKRQTKLDQFLKKANVRPRIKSEDDDEEDSE